MNDIIFTSKKRVFGVIFLKRIELLAPAGDKSSFIGAINAGANAIYLSMKKFGARSFADNFDIEELISLIKYAHLRDVLVYVTVNTVIYDYEFSSLLEAADVLVKNNVDAFIIQDFGVLEIFSKRYPNTELHASTQMNTLNLDQAKFLKSKGVKRIILARETSLDEIKTIKDNLDIEIEVFVHGALCISYSGNCYFSSMIGGRSGNRGECAQSCRLPYELYKDSELVDETSYLLSAKDLVTIDYIKELISSGISSLKIEGRMRKPEYVVQTVLSYRKAIDSFYENLLFNKNEELAKLTSVFNRGQTKGFLLSEVPKEIVNTNRPNHIGRSIGKVIDFNQGKVTVFLSDTLRVNDGVRFIDDKDYGMSVSRILSKGKTVTTAFPNEKIILDSKEHINVGSEVVKTSDYDLENSLSIYLEENYKKVPLKGEIIAFVSKPLKIKAIYGIDNTIEVTSDFIIPPATRKPIDSKSIEEHLDKLGNTPYFWEKLNVKSDDLGFIPIKIINDLRRDVIEKINEARLKRDLRIINSNYNFNIIRTSLSEQKLVCSVNTKEQFEAAIKSNISEIYIEEDLDFNTSDYKDVKIFKRKKRINSYGINEEYQDIVISEVGYLSKNSKEQYIVSDEFLNVNNIHAIHFLHENGVNRVTVSQELNELDIESLANNYKKTYETCPNLEKVVYGRDELMITKYCPIAKTYDTNIGCNLCYKNQYYLKDRFGEMYPLINDGNCNIKIMHSKPLVLIDYLDFFLKQGINTLRLNFTIEDQETTFKIIEAYKNSFNKNKYFFSKENTTLGRFKR